MAMTSEDAVRRIATAVLAIMEKGFVVTGEINVLMPATPGLVSNLAIMHLGNPIRLEMIAKKTEGEAMAADPPALPPAAVIDFINEQASKELRQLAKDVDKQLVAASMGYTGNTCQCGSARMVRRGTCECCEDCGSTSGCS